MEICGNFLSKWNFARILFGRLLARIAKYLLNGSPREVKFHIIATTAKTPGLQRSQRIDNGNTIATMEMMPA